MYRSDRARDNGWLRERPCRSSSFHWGLVVSQVDVLFPCSPSIFRIRISSLFNPECYRGLRNTVNSREPWLVIWENSRHLWFQRSVTNQITHWSILAPQLSRFLPSHVTLLFSSLAVILFCSVYFEFYSLPPFSVPSPLLLCFSPLHFLLILSVMAKGKKETAAKEEKKMGKREKVSKFSEI